MQFGAGNVEDGVIVFRKFVRLRYFVVCCVSVLYVCRSQIFPVMVWLGWMWVGAGRSGAGRGMNLWCFLRNLLCAIGSWNLEIICGVA